MSDVVRPALSALERAEMLLTVLSREHTPAELYGAMHGIRHEVQSARDLLQAFGRDVTAPLPGKVGAGAPETSQAAARAIKTRSGSQRHTLLRELRRSDLTDFQLQHTTGIGANSERPRRLELLEAGYVAAATGVDGERLTRPHPHSRLDCQVWTVTEKGREALALLESGQQVLAYGDGRMPWELGGRLHRSRAVCADAVKRPSGVCRGCGRERRVKNDGTMGSHKMVLNNWYRGSQCAGTDQPPKAGTLKS